MFDYSKLRGKIREVFGTQEEFAKAMNISGARFIPFMVKLKLKRW